jgi:hypothetical protein
MTTEEQPPDVVALLAQLDESQTDEVDGSDGLEWLREARNAAIEGWLAAVSRLEELERTVAHGRRDVAAQWRLALNLSRRLRAAEQRRADRPELVIAPVPGQPAGGDPSSD